MSKPLELTVFEKEPGRYGREATYNSPDGLWAYPASHADGYAQRKRLTDAELAAEYHAQHMESVRAFDRAYPYGDGEEVDTENERIAVIERFATLPNYDEVA